MRNPESKLQLTLALAALVVVGTLACSESIENQTLEPGEPENRFTPTMVHQETVVLEVSVESGIFFRHHRGDHGAFRLEEIMSGGVALFDADRDEDLDLLFVHGDAAEGGLGFFENTGGGQFVDRSTRIEAVVSDYGMGCAAADYDGDGWVDLFVTCVGPDILLRNREGESFVDVTHTSGLGDDGFASSSAWFDADRDGDLDLYVARYIDRSSPSVNCRHNITHERDYCNPLSYRSESDLLYRNDNGQFIDVSASSGIGSASGYGLGVMCSDIDQDGAVDVFVANDQSPAFLWMNDGAGQFEDVALFWGCAYDRDGRAIAGMGIVSEDFDGDLDLDLFVTNIRDQDNVFFRLQSGTFSDVSRKWSAGGWLLPYTGFGVASFDQDHDGDLDMYIANGSVAARVVTDSVNRYAEPDLFLRFDGAQFRDASWDVEAGVSRGVARGDVDGDGDIDLVVCRNGFEPLLLLNRSPKDNHWLMISVVDQLGSPILNSRVEIHAAGRSWLAEVRAQESYLSSRDPRVHFGVGAASVIDRVIIRHPNGQTRELLNVSVDQVLLVRSDKNDFRGTEDNVRD